MLHLHRLSIGYREHLVAQSLTASLPKATLTALVGRNGSGKSTLLRTVCGLQRPLEGKVTVTGDDGGEKRIGPKTVSVVLTPSRYLAPAISVADTVALGRIPYTTLGGRLAADDHRAIEKAMEICGIGALRDRNLNTLSDGERQRVLLARTIAQDTPVIILDEPTVFLDYSARVQTMMLLRHLCTTEQKTILFSTHDLETALPAVDTVWAMAESTAETEATSILLTGDARTLIAEGTINRIFPEYKS